MYLSESDTKAYDGFNRAIGGALLAGSLIFVGELTTNYKTEKKEVFEFIGSSIY